MSSNVYPSNAYDNGDMDVDMDIDLGLDPDEALLEAEQISFETSNAAEATTTNTNAYLINGTTGISLQEEKVHIRGLDNLTTEDIKAFASEYFPPDIVRVEWIDDTSANIVYDSPSFSLEALGSFSDNLEDLDPTQLRRAKPLSSHPNVELYVRIAAATDVKKPRARDASRFYLLNPDKDPRERRKEYDSKGRRGRGNYGDRRDTKRAPREEEKDTTPFDVNMYDDDPTSLAARITSVARHPSRVSFSSDQDRRSRRPARLGDELFASRTKSDNNDGRLRDRSASPLRDGDGRMGFGEDEASTRRIRQRSRSPRYRASSSNAGKEILAPVKSSSIPPSTTRELFPHKLGSADTTNREPFPLKSPNGHRRSAAFDAADNSSSRDLFDNRMTSSSSFLITRAAEPVPGRARSRTLADRISDGPSTTTNASKSSSSDAAISGFNIRGTALAAINDVSSSGNGDFLIRGAAGLGKADPRVKELFPERTVSGTRIGGNEGKELFAGKAKVRRRAEDMYF